MVGKRARVYNKSLNVELINKLRFLKWLKLFTYMYTCIRAPITTRRGTLGLPGALASLSKPTICASMAHYHPRKKSLMEK